jgi:hypothetical protein
MLVVRFTVSVAVPVTPLALAEMAVVPWATAVANPVFPSTLATEGTVLVHANAIPGMTAPLALRASALNATAVGTAVTVGVLGDTTMLATVSVRSIVSVALP